MVQHANRSGDAWLYEEANGLADLQRGGIGLLGGAWPPPRSPPLLVDEDLINDETCGMGPDSIIF